MSELLIHAVEGMKSVDRFYSGVDSNYIIESIRCIEVCQESL